MAVGHVRVSSRLVDEDKALGIETELAVELALAPPQDVGSILLDSMAGFYTSCRGAERPGEGRRLRQSDPFQPAPTAALRS